MRQSLTLIVDGMTCASCVGRVERVLRAQAGVQAASVNLALGAAHVVFEAPAQAQDLVKVVTKAGYAAREQTARGLEVPNPNSGARWGEVAEASLLTLPVFLVEMGGHVFASVHQLRAGLMGDLSWALVQMVLIGLVLAGPGRGFFTKGIRALWRGAPDMNALVAIGAGAAYVYSSFVAITLAGGPVYFESAGVTVALILMGRAFEAQAKGAAGAAIARLVQLQPLTALRVQADGDLREVPIEGLTSGDQIIIRAGERVAADGVVVSGQSSIDSAMLTGEAMPVPVRPGDAVTGGCINGTGSLTLRITAAGEASVLARITQMVAEAQSGKLPVQDMVDRITNWFVPAVMALATLTFGIWMLAGASLGTALIHAVSVLIIACPCAMGLAVPVSILVGTGRGAQMGVLFRGGAALQRLSQVRVVAFDKTGTLTLGQPRVQAALDKGGALALAAGIEGQSTHPLAKAILDHARKSATAAQFVTEIETLPGLGARANFGGEVVLLGAQGLMPPLPPDFAAFAAHAETQGQGIVFVAHGGIVLGAFAVADSVKPNAAQTLGLLRALGLRMIMLTGDRAAVAQKLGASLRLDDIRADLRPEDKARAISEIAESCAFVGDGINDAPALARAEVGISMGTGTDVAIESGDVVLVGGDLAGVARAIALSRAVMRNIQQNLFWAFAYNAALIPVAMGVLVPFGGPALSPMLAALAMAFSSVFVLGNALRLRNVDFGLAT